MTHLYLRDEQDGLQTRDSQYYAREKLAILKGYMARFTTAMKDKRWRALNYIDLQAGPGKNSYDQSNEVLLGSPLLALTTRFQFDNLYLVEMGSDEFRALQTRVSVSDRSQNVHLIQEDCNLAVDRIVREVQQLDRPFIGGKWPSLNLAFLDPEGLEIAWKTVEKLAAQQRMDLIINFSTSGITRNAGMLVGAQEETIIDRFFGTREWRKIYQRVRQQGGSAVRRELIDFYLQRLVAKGYVETARHEQEFKNRRNVQMYTMIFASKHDLGIQFWNAAVQDVEQPKLF